MEQGKSGAAGKRRPLFDRIRKDAALRKFGRVLVWKVTRLGRDMRDVISTVYDLADLGITIVPLKSQTGPRHGYKTIARLASVSATTVRRILGAKTIPPDVPVKPVISTPVDAIA